MTRPTRRPVSRAEMIVGQVLTVVFVTLGALVLAVRL